MSCLTVRFVMLSTGEDHGRSPLRGIDDHFQPLAGLGDGKGCSAFLQGEVVGDLLVPAEGENHPAVILVHGDGPATRRTASTSEPTTNLFVENGYAVFSWDKPGSGESTGQINNALTDRSEILADGLAVLAEHPNIDSSQIGLWGISQAGWVMPLALEHSDDVAFMVVVSGGAEDGIEQGAYMVSQQVLSAGATTEEAALVDKYWSQQNKATDYEQYREAMEVLGGAEQFELLARTNPQRILRGHPTLPVLPLVQRKGVWEKVRGLFSGKERW